MSDLPSREEIAAERVRVGGPNTVEIWPILEAYVSGRLVDREAIDYEAGWEQIPKTRPVSPARFVFAVDVALGSDQEAAIGDTG